MTDWILAIVVSAGVAGGLWYLWDRRKREMRYAEQVLEGVAPLPSDLQVHVEAWSDPWAQEDANRAIREHYAESRSWDRVRTDFVS